VNITPEDVGNVERILRSDRQTAADIMRRYERGDDGMAGDLEPRISPIAPLAGAAAVEASIDSKPTVD
jgi:hypothetical protein